MTTFSPTPETPDSESPRVLIDRGDHFLLHLLRIPVGSFRHIVHEDRKRIPLLIPRLQITADRADAVDEPALAKDPPAQVALETLLERPVFPRDRKTRHEHIPVLAVEVVS